MKNKLLKIFLSLFLILGIMQTNTNTINAEDTTDYLCFTAVEANSTVKLTKTGTPTVVSLETSTDKSIWTDYTIDTEITLTNIGDTVYFRNKSETTTGYSDDMSNYYQFVMTGEIAASGDVTTLINKNGTIDLTLAGDYCFYGLFEDCSSLTFSPSLPATTLTNYCYYNMFCGSGLIIPPELPATTLADYCYSAMFIRCGYLTIVPELPATTLTNGCYSSMFALGSLFSPPELPATILADKCYEFMFYSDINMVVSDTPTVDCSIPFRVPSNNSITVRGADDFAVAFNMTPTDDGDGVITLYLKSHNVTITYDGNGNTGGSVPSSSAYTILDEATIKGNENSLTKTGKMFKGWSLRPDGKGKVYNPGNTFNIRGNMTLYAIWDDSNYSFTSGNGQTYTKGSLDNKLFICDGPLANLTSVQIDDIEITETSQYTKEEGSTKITLLGSYLETLDLGSHTLKLTYSDGPTPTVTFNVINPSTPEPEPDTNDNNNNTYIIPKTGIEATSTNNHSLLKLTSLSLVVLGTYLVIKKNKDN